MEHTLEFILNYCIGDSLAERPARRSDNALPSPRLSICEMWVFVLGGIRTLPGDIGTVLKSPAGWAPSYTRACPLRSTRRSRSLRRAHAWPKGNRRWPRNDLNMPCNSAQPVECLGNAIASDGIKRSRMTIVIDQGFWRMIP